MKWPYKTLILLIVLTACAFIEKFYFHSEHFKISLQANRVPSSILKIDLSQNFVKDRFPVSQEYLLLSSQNDLEKNFLNDEKENYVLQNDEENKHDKKINSINFEEYTNKRTLFGKQKAFHETELLAIKTSDLKNINQNLIIANLGPYSIVKKDDGQNLKLQKEKVFYNENQKNIAISSGRLHLFFADGVDVPSTMSKYSLFLDEFYDHLNFGIYENQTGTDIIDILEQAQKDSSIVHAELELYRGPLEAM